MAASLDRWVAYREFWFDQNENDMHSSDRARIEDIAAYMQENPNLELGIDGSSNTRAGSARDSEMASNRVNSIREALISAGVPANRISEGAYGDHNLRRDQRVDLLVRTSPGAMDRQRQQDQSGQQQRARSGNQADQQTQRAQNNGMFNDTVTENWEAMRTFWFDQSSHNIHPTDRPKVDEIAAYMRRNQSVEIGLDGTAPTGDANSQSSNRESAVRRSNAVREALIAAGVLASRIKTGAFGDEDHRRSGRVEVLIRMSQLAQVP